MQRIVRRKTLPIIFLFLMLLHGALPVAALPDEKISPQDLLTKHREAIATAQVRNAVNSRLTLGTCKVTFRSGSVTNGAGRVVLASDGLKNLIGMAFQSTEYPHEKIGYDGKDVSIGYLKPGIRSSLGNFIRSNEQIFTQGLFGGALSASWPLLDANVRQAKLEFGGTKKIDGAEAYVLRYYPQKGADIKITLFFDKQTFRHIRSEYYRVVESRQGGAVGGLIGDRSAGSASQQEVRYTLIEDFSDFKNESGLMLPHSYKIQLWVDNAQGAVRNTWELNLTQFGFNHQFDEGAFDVNKTNG